MPLGKILHQSDRFALSGVERGNVQKLLCGREAFGLDVAKKIG